MVGLHISSAGSLDLAFDRALELRATTFQMFTRNPNQWKFKPIADETVAAFREKRKSSGFARIVDHMPYLPNLASPERSTMKISRYTLDEELKRCEALGIDYLVVHLGSHLGKGAAVGIANVAEACNEAIGRSEGKTMILLENMAGQKNSVGARFEEIRGILDRVRVSEGVGVCLDTCLPPGSPVMTPGAPIPIDRVGVGDEVVGSNGEPTRVTRLVRRPYMGNLVLLKPKGLPWMELTPEHPVLYVRVRHIKNIDESPWRITLTEDPAWIEVGNVKPGDFLILPRLRTRLTSQIDFSQYTGANTRSLPFPSVVLLTNELAELLGLYLAEGYVFIGPGRRGGNNSKIYLAFGKHEKDLIKRAIRLYEQVFSLRAWTDEKETSICVVVGSNILARFLRDNFGHNARTKRIPAFIMGASNEVIRSFVEAYRKGDGNVNEFGLTFTTASTSVAIQLIHLLARIDIHAVHQWHEPTEGSIEGRALHGNGWHSVHFARAEAQKLGYDFNLPVNPRLTILRENNNFLIPIGAVRRSYYEGEVVNLTTESGSFLAPFVATHNCHLYAAGFDLGSDEAVGNTMGLFDQVVGLDRLRAVHLNDSKGTLGSRLDRHENVGKGKIGRKGIRAFLHYSGVRERPLIMETPFEDINTMKASIKLVRTLLQ